MSQQSSSVRSSTLSFNSPRASPFRRPESPVARSPSTVRASTPTNTSPLKQSSTLDFGDRSSSDMSPSANSSSRSLSRPTHSPAELSFGSPTRISRPLPQQTMASATPPSSTSARPTTTTTTTTTKPKDPLSLLPAHQLHTMRESFSVLDRSNTGLITPSDLAESLTHLGLSATDYPSPSSLASFFPSPTGSGVSSSPGGGINLSTYLNSIAASLAPLSDPAELLAAFAAFDADDSGQIAAGELRDAVLHVAAQEGKGEGKGTGLGEAEVDRVLGDFGAKRAFGRGTGTGSTGAREEVFKYRDFVAATGMVGPQAGDAVKT